MSIEERDRLQRLIGPDYELQWVIGHGGMSTVWLADDHINNREVAIKVLRPEFSNNSEFLNRFRNEALAAEGTVSDAVVATYDYREVPAEAGHILCFIAMEYVRGESLADLLAREHSLPEDLALDVLEQAAHGLSIIHRMGLIHRDIKPGNLLVTQSGQVKITDFGIAKAAAAVPLTRTGMVVGTAQYVSPEQAQGQEVDSATDVYSLAVVGFEMLAGYRPFTGDSGVSVALAHVNNEPPPLPTSISAETRELISIGLRKQPTRRFADGNEFALAIAAVRKGNRPPHPASAEMNQVAREPSPTQATQILGRVAQPTTVRPAGSASASIPAVAASPARPARSPSRARGCGLGVLIAVLAVALLAVLGYLAMRLDLLGGTGSSSSSTTPTVTEWVTPTSPEEASTSAEPSLTVVYTTVTPEEESDQDAAATTAEPAPHQTTAASTPRSPGVTMPSLPSGTPGGGTDPGGTQPTGGYEPGLPDLGDVADLLNPQGGRY